jgi:HAD superfamily hydrolase (TIGR01662 family)
MTINAIFFDAGNTLIFIDPRIVIPIIRRHGTDVDEDLFWKAEFKARVGLMNRVEDGAWGTEEKIWTEYFQTFLRGCGVGEEVLEVVGKEVVEAHRKRHLWSFMHPSTLGALEHLRDAGYRMAIISNADGRIEGLIEGVGIKDFFEFVMDSKVEGVEKPDPEIFLRACNRMGVDPSESLYVGDLYGVDVVGARGVGMEAVLMDPQDLLEYPVDRLPNVEALPEYLARVSPRP